MLKSFFIKMSHRVPCDLDSTLRVLEVPQEDIQKAQKVRRAIQLAKLDMPEIAAFGATGGWIAHELCQVYPEGVFAQERRWSGVEERIREKFAQIVDSLRTTDDIFGWRNTAGSNAQSQCDLQNAEEDYLKAYETQKKALSKKLDSLKWKSKNIYVSEHMAIFLRQEMLQLAEHVWPIRETVKGLIETHASGIHLSVANAFQLAWDVLEHVHEWLETKVRGDIELHSRAQRAVATLESYVSLADKDLFGEWRLLRQEQQTELLDRFLPKGGRKMRLLYTAQYLGIDETSPSIGDLLFTKRQLDVETYEMLRIALPKSTQSNYDKAVAESFRERVLDEYRGLPAAKLLRYIRANTAILAEGCNMPICSHLFSANGAFDNIMAYIIDGHENNLLYLLDHSEQLPLVIAMFDKRFHGAGGAALRSRCASILSKSAAPLDLALKYRHSLQLLFKGPHRKKEDANALELLLNLSLIKQTHGDFMKAGSGHIRQPAWSALGVPIGRILIRAKKVKNVLGILFAPIQ